ncbi:MAG TPA: 2,3-diaminopropionate biosynthesis protein SbnA [Pyrinomonadaceae bacterium]|nr:2,3-diaminopropionate biosynthesis protein SbnA [Pyrinomonadaceae bacterium]
MHHGILSVIGNTPLIRLTRVLGDTPFRLYAKLESLNPGGSTKDRPAYTIIKRGLETGDIKPNTTIIESSSGNMGIGLAQACAYFNLRLICVVDPKTTTQNIHLLSSYGAEVDMVLKPDPETGEFLQARLNRVQQLLHKTENSFWPNQYSNEYNPVAHHETMREIASALDNHIDYLFCATSTCGTIRGCVEYLREHRLSTRTIAVDAKGSVIFGGKKAKRLIPGHGAAVRPCLYQPDLADEHLLMTDLDCVVGCRRLVRTEAILVGGSSGAVLMAVDRLKEMIPAGSTCVVIFADRGERYLDTIYSDDWVSEHFGDVSDLWEGAMEDQRWLAATY